MSTVARRRSAVATRREDAKKKTRSKEMNSTQKTMTKEKSRLDSCPQFDYISGLSPLTQKETVLINTLAWAARRGISFDEAILALTESVQQDDIIHAKWYVRLNLMAKSISGGLPLAAAIKKHIRGFIPDYLIEALEMAENEKRLEAALPLLANNLYNMRQIQAQRRFSLSWLLLPIFVLSTGLFLFIVPKLSKIADEICGLNQLPYFTSVVFSVSESIINHFIEILALVMAYLFLLHINFSPTRIPFIGYLWEKMIMCIPWMGKDYRRLRVLEICGAMGAFMSVGENINKSAQLSRECLKSRWVKSRLKKFIAALNAGENWPEAWRQANIGFPIHDWILKNAASREDPIGGFAQINFWLEQEISTNTLIFVKIMEIVKTLINAIIVGSVVIAVFLCLIKFSNEFIIW